MKEMIEKRLECVKHFDLEDGKGTKRLVIGLSPKHYCDAQGNWQDASDKIDAEGRVCRCGYDVSLLKDKIGYEGLDPNREKVYLCLKDIPYKAPVVDGNTAIYENIEPDVDFKITFSVIGIKTSRILKTASAKKDATYHSNRKNKAKGALITLGADRENRNVKVEVATTFPGSEVDRRVNEGPLSPEIQEQRTRDERFIKVTFQDQVMTMNKETRKREWSNDVAYPVEIN